MLQKRRMVAARSRRQESRLEDLLHVLVMGRAPPERAVTPSSSLHNTRTTQSTRPITLLWLSAGFCTGSASMYERGYDYAFGGNGWAFNPHVLAHDLEVSPRCVNVRHRSIANIELQ